MKTKSLFVISVLLILPLLFGGASQARAANLVHIYELNGNFLDELGGPALIPNGSGSLSDTGYLVPDHGSGLSLQGAIDPDNYSIEILVRLDGFQDPNLCSGGDHICSSKIIDFKNLTSDDGLYTPSSGDASDGRMQLCCSIVDESPEGTIVYGETVHLVLTRDRNTDAIVGYINGLKVISIVDTLDMTTFDGPQNVVHFLMDDSTTIDDPPLAFIDRIRIYNGPLSAKEVFNLVIQQPWAQVNESGFGEPLNVGVTSLEEFNGQLYAGSANWNDGGQVWRSEDGTSWTPVSDVRFGDIDPNTNFAIIDLIEFNAQLYAGTGWGLDNAVGQIWRSSDGTTWDPVISDGFGDANNFGISTFTVFSDTLYAAAGNDVTGFQVWRSETGDSLSWTNVITAGLGYPTSISVTGFYEFNNALYAAIESNFGVGPSRVWRSETGDSLSWTPVTTDGFDDTENYSTGGFASFNGYLYLGTRNDGTGAQLFRSNDGTTWMPVISDGFGDSNNVKIESLFTFEDFLYAVTYNEVTGMEVWSTDDGTTWKQVNIDGFGNSNNYATLWSNASVIFDESVFVGTWNNVDGGQVWMKLRQIFLPLVIK